jgi:hypothetical protein
MRAKFFFFCKLKLSYWLKSSSIEIYWKKIRENPYNVFFFRNWIFEIRLHSLDDFLQHQKTNFYCFKIHSKRLMKQASVSQQMSVNQGQFIINKPPNKLPYESPNIIHFILPLLVGILLCGVPLASLLTLYLSNPCKWKTTNRHSINLILFTPLKRNSFFNDIYRF